jgi:hypothetical protein
MSIATTTTITGRRVGHFNGPHNRERAAQNERRNAVIRALAASNAPIESLAVLTGLTRKQVKRIANEKGETTDQGGNDGASLSNGDLREFHKQYGHDQGVVEWLASLQPGKRQNGRPMVSNQ